MIMNKSAASGSSRKRKIWHYTPDLPIEKPPLFCWPPRLWKILIFILGAWRPDKARIVFFGIALGIWYFFSPSLEQAATFQVGWMFEIWVRNFILVLIVAGGLHLHFYTFRRQKEDLQYDTRPFATKNRIFHFNNQVFDNMFWTLTTGVLAWTGWESIIMWAYANGYATMITFESNPVWFLSLIILVPFWAGFFFYWQHRAFHTRLAYTHIHSWHHKNVNTGPWSGLAMHPVEHIVLMADTLIFFVIASHPVHAIFLLLTHGLGAPASHTGFEAARITKNVRWDVGDFYHHLHHRFIDCNYGVPETPWDFVFGTFHDGTAEGDQYINDLRRKMYRKQLKSA